MARQQRSVSEVMTEIDLATGPEVMPKDSALRFLQQVITEIEGRIEAIRDEQRDS